MAASNFPTNDSQKGGTSRRALLDILTAAPAVAATATIASSQNASLKVLHEDYGDPPVRLARSAAGRKLSRRRYLNAEEFFPEECPKSQLGLPTFLYFAGITAQLAISAHLIDVGFSDDWCARYIGLNVAKSLAYANATGLGLDCPQTERLAQVLSPYNQWNCRSFSDGPHPTDGNFPLDEIQALLGTLINHVGFVTGHLISRRTRQIALQS